MLKNSERLAAVGPRSGTHGFPLWYRDGNGVRLELGLDRADQNTPAIGDPPETPPPSPIPADFPDESFYMLVEARMTTGGMPSPGRARLVLALEAAFGGAGTVAQGQQMVFGRIRVRIDGALPNTAYSFTHPYGETGPLTSDDRGRVFVTEDIGAVPLDFRAALDSQIAPFLRWAPGAGGGAAPKGYLGDGVTEHGITGSPFGTNFFRIDGPNIADAGGPRDPADPTNVHRIQTSLFTVQAKLATVVGVDVPRAVYTRTPAGEVVVDVFATSEAGQTIEVGGPGISSTVLRPDGERYVARVSAGSAVPVSIEARNATDIPPTVVTTSVVDAVTIGRADYDVGASSLTVEATSSDAQTPPDLTLEDDDEVVIGALVGGTVTATGIDAPPVSVRVRSSAGGDAERVVALTGAAMAPIPVAAEPGPPRTVQQGQTVVLDGSGSSGEVSSFSWTQTSGPDVVLSAPKAARTTFVAPATAGDLAFTLTVDGAGGPVTGTVVVTVAALSPPVAKAGVDTSAEVGASVTLDGGASTGAATLAWSQVAGPPVGAITGADTTRPSFTMPAGSDPVVVRLTVTGPGGPATTDDVTVARTADDVQVTTAQFRTSKLQWRISGTATGSAPDRVAVTFGGHDLGEVLVDATHTWDVRRTVLGSEPELRPPLGATVTVTSTRGGSRDAAVTVRS